MSALVLASRGDPLSPSLFAELARRYPIGAVINPELTGPQRLAVAAATFQPARVRWAERFWKSELGYRMRSANAARNRARLAAASDPVLQVHSLFEVPGAPCLLYVDCTHRQSAQQWPAWNPLHGARLARWYEREGNAYRRAVHVFAFCTETATSLVEDYQVDPARVSVVGAAANLGAAPVPAPGPVPEAGSPAVGGPAEQPGPPTVLFVGNDFARKGGPVLLEAFASVRERVPGATLRLVGTDPGIGPAPGVEVLGRVRDPAAMHRLFTEADVFCLPSVFDPLPGALLEAMSYALPCVTTATCGIPDVVTSGRDGVLVPVGTRGALAGTVTDLLGRPDLRRRLGTAARERVTSQFTWPKVVDRMAPVLDRCLDGPALDRMSAA